jgi:hypothetical protein
VHPADREHSLGLYDSHNKLANCITNFTYPSPFCGANSCSAMHKAPKIL